MNKKSLLLIIVGLILIFGGGLLLYGKNISFTKDKLPAKEKDHQEIELNEFIHTYDKLIVPKIEVYNNVLGQNYPIKNLDEINDMQKTLVLLTSINKDGSKKEVSTDELDETKYKYFLSVNYYKKPIKSNNLTVYKVKDDKYLYNGQDNNLNIFPLQTEFKELYTDYIVVAQKLLFLKLTVIEEPKIIKNEVYKDPKAKEKVYEFEGEPNFTDEEQKQLSDKLDTYLYRFEKYGDEYLLTSVIKSDE
ncbi:MAG: hypothetical protein IJH13_00975 [Bacilli bacterium]|nr:hypothetical protein [Bacilli bacterium]